MGGAGVFYSRKSGLLIDLHMKTTINAQGIQERRDALWRKRLEMEQAFDEIHRQREASRSLFRYLNAIDITRALLTVSGMSGRGRRNVLDLRLVEAQFTFPNLPGAFDGFRILFLADLHFNHSVDVAGTVLRVAEGVNADLWMLGGDYRYTHYGLNDAVQDGLRRIVEGCDAPEGAVAILGNHDSAVHVDYLRDLGVRTLVNENLSIERGDALWIGGVDDSHRFECADVRVASEGIPAEAFSIMLAHTPESAFEAAARGFALYLCGHTHGGQIRVPGIGAVYVNARCPRRLCDRRWQVEDMQGYTSRGVGATDVMARFFCPPEATLVTLKRA